VAIAAAVLLLAAAPAVGAVRAPSWRIVAVLRHCGDDSLTSIVATGPRDAWALGAPQWSTAPGCGADVEHWDGTAWRRVPVPGDVRFGLFPTVNPITATSASDAWIFPARGAPIGLSGQEYNYALHWNGTAWRASSFPGKLVVQSAAALRPNDVWAFGVIATSALTTVPYTYTAHYNGRTWQRVSLRVAPLAVRAAGDDLWAIGPTVATANKPASQQHIIAMRWNGRSWTGLAVPKVAVPAGQSRFNASIVATGGPRDLWWYYQASNDDTSTSRIGLLHWNGTAWHAFPLGAAIAGVDAMTKDGHGGIWLKADVGIASDQYFYHYSGGRWTRSVVPSPRNYLNWVFGLAWIPGTTSVWADGEADSNVHAVGVIVKYGS
jgi:hypothetical protein